MVHFKVRKGNHQVGWNGPMCKTLKDHGDAITDDLESIDCGDCKALIIEKLKVKIPKLFNENTTLKDIKICNRPIRILNYLGIYTVCDLLEYEKTKSICTINGIGRKSYFNIKEQMSHIGCELKSN